MFLAIAYARIWCVEWPCIDNKGEVLSLDTHLRGGMYRVKTLSKLAVR